MRGPAFHAGPFAWRGFGASPDMRGRGPNSVLQGPIRIKFVLDSQGEIFKIG